MEKDTEEFDAILENWIVRSPREDGTVCLSGDIFEDKKNRFDDGELVRTSFSSGKQKFSEGFIIQTRNTKYKLGKKLARTN